MKLCWLLPLAAALGCGSGSSTHDSGPTVDADPNAPDADPNAPDSGPLPAGRIFDHRHIDVGAISSGCLDSLTDGSFVFHYAHRSHGSQIIVGAESLEASAPELGFAASYCSIPGESGVLKMWDGMTDNNLVQPEAYWATEGGMNEVRAILNANPSLTYSMWAWSFEISEQTEQSVQQYLDAMATLEGEFPGVRFIYMTGPAQGEFEAVNRYERNQQIRDYCVANGKLLYDFEDLEAWWDGDYHTVTLEGVTMPMEHPHFSLDTSGNEEYMWTHTTQASCEQKARAFWGMMAVLEGCAGG